MENFDSLDQNINQSAPEKLAVTDELRYYWNITSKWALFFAVLGFVIIGLSLIAFGSMATILQDIANFSGQEEFAGMMTMMGGGLSIVMLVVLAAQAAIHYFHLQFSQKIKQAMLNNEQSTFEAAWTNLRNHFRWYGIVIIAILSFYVLSVLVLGAMMASVGNG